MEMVDWVVIVLAILYMIITFPLGIVVVLSYLSSMRCGKKELTKEEWKMGGRQ